LSEGDLFSDPSHLIDLEGLNTICRLGMTQIFFFGNPNPGRF
jgi:hypothetical protein